MTQEEIKADDPVAPTEEVSPAQQVDEESDIILAVSKGSNTMPKMKAPNLNMDIIPEYVYEEGITSAK